MNEIETAAGECLVVSGLPDRIPKHCSEVNGKEEGLGTWEMGLGIREMGLGIRGMGLGIREKFSQESGTEVLREEDQRRREKVQETGDKGLFRDKPS